MPGARIEIELSDLGGVDHVLVAEGLRTGGDAWPRVKLASVIADKTTAVEPWKGYRFSARGPRIGAGASKFSATAAKPLDTIAACDPLAGRERTIFFVKNPNFGDGDGYTGKDQFGVIAGVRDRGGAADAPVVAFRRTDLRMSLEKMERIDLADAITQSRQPYTEKGTANFAPAFGNAPEYGNVCVTRSDDPAGEVWVIENWTNEIHNFHIHQSRFNVFPKDPGDTDYARYFNFPCKSSGYSSDAGCLPDANPADQYADELIADFFMGHTSLGASQTIARDSAHDSVPVPRGTNVCDGHIWTPQEIADATDAKQPVCNPGRVALRLVFNRAEQVGDFVYHCHILEHEDRGMMGIVHVIDPARAQRASALEAPASLLAWLKGAPDPIADAPICSATSSR